MNINVNVSTLSAPRAVFVKPVKPVAPVEPAHTLTDSQKQAIIAVLDSVYGPGKGIYQAGRLTLRFGVKHWTRIPAACFSDAIEFLCSSLKRKPSQVSKVSKPVKPSKPSQVWQDERHPAAPVDPETQLYFAADQFRAYHRWFIEQVELMEHCAASCEKTYKAIKGQYLK